MMGTSYFDDAAATWDNEPRRIELMKVVGEAILREARPTKEMDALDYGCGTGLVGLFILPHVRSVTGADNSAGMLDVLRKKIAESGIRHMSVVQLDLQHDPLPAERYHLIVTNMTLHHVADTGAVLKAFHELLLPGGTLCIADLDAEPGIFHPPHAAASVHHNGFDRGELKSRLEEIGFEQVRDATAHTIRRPVQDGGERDFPVFLITARRSR
ncbi:MAG: class I SAM-dependent methyltransferase [Phycisphaerae bacterium]